MLALGTSPGTPVLSTWVYLEGKEPRDAYVFARGQSPRLRQVNPFPSSILKALISVFVNFLVLVYFTHLGAHFYYVLLFVLVLFSLFLSLGP